MSKVFVDITIANVEGMKNIHSFRKTETYLNCKLDGRVRKSQVVKTDLSSDPDVSFHAVLTFELDPTQIKDIPTMSAELTVMDKATFGSDNKLGHVLIPLAPYELGGGEKDASFDLDTSGKVNAKIKIEKRTG